MLEMPLVRKISDNERSNSFCSARICLNICYVLRVSRYVLRSDRL